MGQQKMIVDLGNPKDSGKTYYGAISSTTKPHISSSELNMHLIAIENWAHVTLCVTSAGILLM
jgi:hypothetical protein